MLGVTLTPMPRMKRLFTTPLVVLAALILFLEEWLWELVKVLSAVITKLPPLRWYEHAIVRLPPYPTLIAFLVPGVLLIPVKIGALWLVGNGHALAGLATIVAAKVAGTAVVARSFVLCKPKLLTIPWFARTHDWFFALRDRVYASVKAIPAFQRVWLALKLAQARIGAAVARLVGGMPGGGGLTRRWRAARRKIRQVRREARADDAAAAERERNVPPKKT